ncbi:MAG: pyridoxal 5'-phosphate synthase glutaminase subunit PdxT [Dehalococcoidales bacterium]|nr:pyridoxal 5'-phosphate synthase glutaminase subunit PdxT [Dehalococcoidales bacterium]
MKIGVLALQGDFIEHVRFLEKLGARVVTIRKPDELAGLDGLVIPGGESTTMVRLMYSYGLFQPLKALIRSGLPVMGTCAGMILLARKVSNPDMETLAVIDVAVKRNALGRQVDSFEAELDVPSLGEKPFPAVFIRAPVIEDAGSRVEVLARLPDGSIVAARQENLLALAFHPELGHDVRLHRYFLEMVASHLLVVARQEAAIPAD